MNAAMPNDEKTRENKVRRVAERRGLKLEKSKRRDMSAIDYGKYRFVDASSNFVIAGATNQSFELTIDEAEKLLDDGLKAKFK